MRNVFTSNTKSRTFTFSARKPVCGNRFLSKSGNCRLRLRQALSVTLLVCLLTATTPAAPRAVLETGKEWKVSLIFWFYSSGLPKTLAKLAGLQVRPEIATQERQRDRDAKVKRIEIQPGNITLQVGSKAIFSAVAYDKDDNSVGGINWTWKSAAATGRLPSVGSR